VIKLKIRLYPFKDKLAKEER